ncbi:MAG: acyltransferase family protein [Tsuneonella sp.]
MTTTPPGLARNDYRPEIDGLRAISVMSVIVYHANANVLAGGFLGVDVFFVISGFLITRHIYADLSVDRFSLAEFYLRRVRRIAPALLFVCALATPFAFWLLLPDDLQNYGQSLFASIASVNNILLWLTTDYFSLGTAFKPLVHTWSLGIEEQYYVLVPIALALAWRAGRRSGVVAVLLVGSLLSIVAMELWREADPSGNFYLLPSRFWELGLGGIAGLYRERWNAATPPVLRQGIAALSLAGVTLPMVFYSEAMNLPSLATLLPVAGAMGVLVFCTSNGVGSILAVRPAVGLGLISYSAYLFHQPVFAFLRAAQLEEVSPLQLYLATAVVLVLAYLSWRFVELPFRDRRRMPNRTLVIWTGTSATVLAGIGLALHFTSGVPGRFPALTKSDPTFGAREFAAYVDAPFAYENRPLDPATRERNLLVLGNSFARDFINMGRETQSFAGWKVSYDSVEFCREGSSMVLAKAANAGAVVIASDEVAELAPCYRAMVTRLREAGVRHVAVIGTKNFGSNNNAVMRLAPAERENLRVRPSTLQYEQNRSAAAALGPEYVDIFSLLDDGSSTVPVFTPGGQFISQDRLHLTRPGAVFVGNLVFNTPQLEWLKQTDR